MTWRIRIQPFYNDKERSREYLAELRAAPAERDAIDAHVAQRDVVRKHDGERVRDFVVAARRHVSERSDAREVEPPEVQVERQCHQRRPRDVAFMLADI